MIYGFGNADQVLYPLRIIYDRRVITSKGYE